jgi:hypothetical protein
MAEVAKVVSSAGGGFVNVCFLFFLTVSFGGAEAEDEFGYGDDDGVWDSDDGEG